MTRFEAYVISHFSADLQALSDKAYDHAVALQRLHPELERDRVVAAECTTIRRQVCDTLAVFFERALTKHDPMKPEYASEK